MKLENLLHKRDTQAVWRIGSHILFWIVFFSSFFYYNKISFNPYGDLPFSYLAPLRLTISLIIVFYPLVYVVGLRLFHRKQWGLGIAAALLLFLFYAVLDYVGEMLILRFCEVCEEASAQLNPGYHDYLQKGPFPVILSRVVSLGVFFQLLTNLTIPIAFKAGLGYHRYYVRNFQLSRDNVQMELNFLKAQINPHFLFNTLNNLYGLIIHQRNDQSAEIVARLSDFMRYTLYDSNEKNTSLEKEINLIKNYIELEQLRLNYTKVLFKHTTDGKKYFLPPLLFMPIVENAFKYNIDSSQGSSISIKLHVQKDVLDFTIQNTFEPERKSEHKGGLGLINLQKRLLLYFPGKNTYKATINDSTYTAHLMLNLS